MSLTGREKRDLVHAPDNISEALIVIAWLKKIIENKDLESTLPPEEINCLRIYFEYEFDGQKEKILIQFLKTVAKNLKNGSEHGLSITDRIQMEIVLERAIHQARQWHMKNDIVFEASEILQLSQRIVEKPQHS